MKYEFWFGNQIIPVTKGIGSDLLMKTSFIITGSICKRNIRLETSGREGRSVCLIQGKNKINNKFSTYVF